MRKCAHHRHPPTHPLLCRFPLITDLLAVVVYQAHKSKQDRGPDRERALYTGRALILSGLASKLQFRQLLACNIPVWHVCAIMWNNALFFIIIILFPMSGRPVGLAEFS